MGMQNYVGAINKKHTPQSEKADPAQVENSAGGFSFQADQWTRLDRFLILGTEGGSYYAKERDLTIENARVVEGCFTADGPRAVARIVEISKAGRAPKNTPAIFALALATTVADEKTRKAAFAAIPEVCRTGTHLFEFISAVKTMRGFGKGLSKAITAWYTGKPADRLAYQLVKYQQRGGMSHKDVLRITRRHGARGELDPAVEATLRWAVDPKSMGLTRQVSRRTKAGEVQKEYTVDLEKLPAILVAHDRITRPDVDLQDAIKIVTEHKLTHEMVPSQFLGKPEMWEALLPHMPVGAMVRNLGRMTANGLISSPMCSAAKTVIEALNAERIRKARLHPLQVLVALKTYESGHGFKGSLKWNPVRSIVDALDDAFYVSFGNVEPTGKRMLLALDVSGSMAGPEIAGMPGISPRVGSAAMSMVTARVEKQYEVVGFFSGSGGMQFQGQRSYWGGGDGITPLDISPRQRLDDIVKRISGLPFGGTDCALPMRYALERKLEIDTFVIYTDSETWAGTPHPHQALRDYRNKMGIPAKLVVVGMVSNGFTIADPNDPGQLDVVGFDTASPNLISAFSRGDF